MGTGQGEKRVKVVSGRWTRLWQDGALQIQSMFEGTQPCGCGAGEEPHWEISWKGVLEGCGAPRMPDEGSCVLSCCP